MSFLKKKKKYFSRCKKKLLFVFKRVYVCLGVLLFCRHLDNNSVKNQKIPTLYLSCVSKGTQNNTN